MNVVIAGARERNTDVDRQQVEELMDLASEFYPNCIFVTLITHTGVGSFVKRKALTKKADGVNYQHKLVVCDLEVYATGLSRAEVSAFYLARNATLVEAGDLFYYFASANRRGTLEDLITRLDAAGRPYKILLPGEELELIRG